MSCLFEMVYMNHKNLISAQTHESYPILHEFTNISSSVILIIIDYCGRIIYLDELNKEQLNIFFDQFIRFVYDTTDIFRVVTKKNRIYYNPEIIKQESIFYNKMESNVNYQFIFNHKSYKYYHKSETMIELINLLDNKYDLNEISFTYKTIIKLINKMGINDDERGHRNDPNNIKLKFTNMYMLQSGFTLLDFIFGCYRIKSCKFDKWHEQYCDVYKIKQDGSTLQVCVGFYHRS